MNRYLVKTKKNILFIVIVVLLSTIFLLNKKCSSFDTIITISIIPGWLTIWAPITWIDFGNIKVSPASQELSWQFSDFFWISDLDGIDSWYYTTLQSDGLIYWNNMINASIKVDSIQPDLMEWITWNVYMNSDLLSYYPIDISVTYIYRNLWFNNGIINKYGNKPWVKLTVPSFTPPWDYTGVINFDLHANY